ncbi:tetratricopeptide repeat protein [Photobacterium sp. 53610]|uniref:tetratricopeptide repeat protein n=1 Tax=Photobacterium sp. 53610 TaxID=3102789 RepID=UPI002ED94F85
MSQVNQMLNSLSQNGASQGAPELKAARIKPLPKSRWPLWLFSGLMIAGVAGATGWWFGQQDREPVVMHTDAGETMPVSDTLSSPEQDDGHENHQVTPVVSAKPSPKPAEGVALSQQTSAERPTDRSAQKDTKTQFPSEPVVGNSPQPDKAVAEMKSQQHIQSVVPAKTPSQTRAQNQAQPRKLASVAPVSPKPAGVTADDAGPVAEESKDAELLIESVALPPKQLAQVDYDKAMKALSEGDSQKALGYLKSVLDYEPDRVEARQQLSALYYGRGDVRRAMLTLQQGLAKQPEQQTLRLTMAKLLASESQPEVALDVLSKLPREPESEFLALRGALAQQLNNQPLALSSYQQLIETEPFDGRWWLGLGIALDRSEKTADAVAAYSKALKLGQVSGASQQFIRQRLSTLKAQEG